MCIASAHKMENFTIKNEHEQNFLSVLPAYEADNSSFKKKLRLKILREKFDVVAAFGVYEKCSKCNTFFVGDGSVCESCESAQTQMYKKTKNGFTCELCYLTVQRRRDHFFHKNHRCLICGDKLRCHQYKEQHYDGHRNPYGMLNCSQIECTKSYHTWKQLQTHLNHIHKEPDKKTCRICTKKFATASDMKRHIQRVHQGLRPQKRFQCDFCPSKAEYKSHLMKHMETHRQYRTKRFTCDKCDSKFHSKKEIRQHFLRKVKKCSVSKSLKRASNREAFRG